MIETGLTNQPLPPVREDDPSATAGSEIIFHGRVRDTEAGRTIIALDYEHYEGMTEAELESLAQDTVSRFSVHDLICIHRVGRVPVGQASVRVVIRSAHRAESLEALTWFIDEMKKRVPLWKWGVTESGDRFPCGTIEKGAGTQ